MADKEPNAELVLGLELASYFVFPVLALLCLWQLQVLNDLLLDQFLLEGVLDDFHLDIFH